VVYIVDFQLPLPGGLGDSSESPRGEGWPVGRGYRATHPKSPFVNILQVARALPEKRLGLRDNQYAIRYLDGRSEKTVLETPHEIMDVLANDFEIKLPEPLAGLESALSRIMRDSAS